MKAIIVYTLVLIAISGHQNGSCEIWSPAMELWSKSNLKKTRAVVGQWGTQARTQSVVPNRHSCLANNLESTVSKHRAARLTFDTPRAAYDAKEHIESR